MVKKQAMGRVEKASSPTRRSAAPRRLEPAELQATTGGARAHIITGGRDGEDDDIG